VVSERLLGHSSVSFTLGQQEDAAEVVGALVDGAA
jgi:hypothetical protein